jgi:regulator of sigma E protease
MSILLVIAWFFLILSLLVIIHELGHFLAAKLVGIRVDEFGLGYPPRLRKLWRWWNTDFTLNALPFGGFVRLYGDDAEGEAPEVTEVTTTTTEKIDITAGKIEEVTTEKMAVERVLPFSHQSKWRRLVVILAGVLVNFIFGLLGFTVLFMALGIPVGVPIVEIAKGSPAETAQIQTGDIVTAIGRTAIWDNNQLIRIVKEHRGKTINLTIERAGERLVKSIYVRQVAETPDKQGALGVGLDYTVLRFYPWWQMPVRGAWQGWLQSVEFTRLILDALRGIVVTIFQKQQVPQDVAGPVGIVHEAVQAHILEQGLPATVQFTAALSMNLAIMNLLPIPALDGGRALFVVLEAVIGRQRRSRWERRANGIGFAFLIILIVLVTAKDIGKWLP